MATLRFSEYTNRLTQSHTLEKTMPLSVYRMARAALVESPFDAAGAEAQYPPDLELEPSHLFIDLTLDIAARRAAGVVTLTIRSRRAGMHILRLDAVDLDVSDVADPAGRVVMWRNQGQQLTIRWLDAFAAQEERCVAVHYAVEAPLSGLYFSRPSDAYPDMPWYAVTDHETERARHWLPCIDLPNVRTPLDIRLRTEERFTILANGYWVGEEVHGDGTKSAHWRLEQPCPSYLICFAAGEFVRADDGEFDDGEKRVPLAYFCSPQHTGQDVLRSFGRTHAMLAWMTAKLAQPFPYPKYFQWTAPGVSGAMENISLVSWDERFALDAKLASEWAWQVDAVNVHEMAHSYFGDAVVCRDFAHAWLKESWATYIEQVYREETVSADEGRFVFYEHAERYRNEADSRYKRPIVTRHFQSSWDLYDEHLYPGGACRLHMLRCELGDETFWAAVREYLERFNGKVVETDDFRLVLEKHSGRSLGRFFDQWFYQPGYPDLVLSFTHEAADGTGILSLDQKQVDRAADIPAFAFDVEVRWYSGGAWHSQPLHVERAHHTFVLSMPAVPEMILFDPDGKLLHKLSFNPGDDLLRRQLVEGPTVLARIHAAKELAATGRRPNIAAIVDAYGVEPHWGVRCVMAEALAMSNTAVAVAGLAGWIAVESDPLVLPALLEAAAAYRDEAICQAIMGRLERGLGYVATQAAYAALGAQREDAPYDLLLAAAERSGFNGIEQSGALRGLAAARRSAALPLLLRLVRYGGSSYYVRPDAVDALAALGAHVAAHERAQIVDALVELLRDPVHQVAIRAVRGLEALEASSAIAALEAYARSRVHQEAVVARRAVDRLRKKGERTEQALHEKLEDLRNQIRRLEAELAKLKV